MESDKKRDAVVLILATLLPPSREKTTVFLKQEIGLAKKKRAETKDLATSFFIPVLCWLAAL